MTDIEKIMLQNQAMILCFAKDWYDFTAVQYSGKTRDDISKLAESFRGRADGIFKLIKSLESQEGEHDADQR